MTTQLDMQNEIQTLLERIKLDYLNWTSRYGTKELTDINTRMITEFDAGIGYTVGKKYIKVISGGSVWGFVVACDNDKKFAKGAILKAAGYATPARNFSRGNILKGGYNISWTGTN
jgi:hypothetical protein